MIKGTVRFDGLAVSTINADLTKPQLHLEAVAAFVDSSTGETHGWTKATGPVWSKDTLLKFRELTQSMEEDLSKLHLLGASSSSTETTPSKSIGGIGEHVAASGDAPSV